ncbi:hypothetical protein, partial [Treponema endosymbiont of Eucomonympha sp.]|uniref:hypothetical protein n=1 Tax=Treponema endosymbiont of Eucomonympha sp. TaxID=1580831 RepID=UPI001930FFFF
MESSMCGGSAVTSEPSALRSSLAGRYPSATFVSIRHRSGSMDGVVTFEAVITSRFQDGGR